MKIELLQKKIYETGVRQFSPSGLAKILTDAMQSKKISRSAYYRELLKLSRIYYPKSKLNLLSTPKNKKGK